MADESAKITPGLLLQAYAAGVFPMAESREADEIHWVDPRRRGIFPIDGFHISRSLRRRILSGVFTVTTDRAFDAVIDGCAGREETWINAEIRSLYLALFEMGHA
ncbi:MAG: leucyl/phenylalanyl-tRNA--protein transferase, partial [Paracoccaceae bacterium]|nr:leucyl/phenylalanyl-tRNA--protein transferase [Paracoccaceae bacterium]